jgi:Domain of unknown function (DUF397)
MADRDFPGGTWRKSSYSGGGNDCVEVLLSAETVGVRDSKNPTAGALTVPTGSWRALLHAVGRD